MSQFMSNDISHPDTVGEGALLGVQDQVGFPVGDQTPVLSGPRGVVRNGSHVQLGKGVVDVEVGLRQQYSGMVSRL